MSLIAFEKYQSPLVVVTRPFPDCTRTAQQVERVGFDSFEEPLGIVSYFSLDDVRIPREVGFILTSHRAVSALKTISFSTYPTFYVVGERTAHTLRQNGFDDIAVTAANVANLTDWLIKRKDMIQTPLIYLRGRDVSVPLAETLTDKGFNIDEHTVYAIDTVESFSNEFTALLTSQRALVILLMSERTAKAFMRLLSGFDPQVKDRLRYLCFSPKIAETVEEHGGKSIDSCDDPTEDALVQKLMLMYDEKI